MQQASKKIGPRHPNHIDLSQETDVHYWTEKFLCSRAALEAAVGKVGNSPDAVLARLNSLQERGSDRTKR